MQKAKIKIEYRPVKNFQGYGLGSEIEIYFDTPEGYDSEVKYWQAKVRKLVQEEMKKDQKQVRK